MPTLSVHLFGKLHVRCHNQPVVFNALRAQELFCYLLLHWQRPHSREMLPDILWRESSDSQSRKTMRQAIWQLQTAQGSLGELLGMPILQLEPEWIRTNQQIDIWLDVAVFEDIYALCQGIEGCDLTPQTARMLETAVSLYQGDLLESWYADWCLYERERLQNMYLAILDKLMDYCAVQGRYEAGMEYGQYSLRYDRARECTHRRMMVLQYLRGDRTGALRQYERCVSALSQELGVSPAQSTCRLYQQIRVDQLETLQQELALANQQVEAVSTHLPSALNQLEQLQTALAHIQAQIAEDIRAVEYVLCSQQS
jgi:DNA-binding SARP family transcriptional activator